MRPCLATRIFGGAHHTALNQQGEAGKKPLCESRGAPPRLSSVFSVGLDRMVMAVLRAGAIRVRGAGASEHHLSTKNLAIIQTPLYAE